MSLPELDAFGPSVRVPELRDVRLTGRIRDVIDHPDFQRLRRVRQLGPTHLVYPGATHTRFEHSLGAYGCAQRFLLSLLRHPAFAAAVTETDLLTGLLAALLHDVGHYPYAHSLEALHRRGRETPRHEDLAARLLRGPLGNTVERACGVDRARVIALIRTKHDRHDNQIDRILACVVSSAIDADKMDYLERDSAHLGVPYGRSFDAGRLIAALTLNEAEDAIAIDARGKIPAEMFVFSRYMMFSEVYWHRTVRAASAMVEAALADVFDALDPDLDPGDWLLGRSDDELLDRSLWWPRRLYKRVVTFSKAYAEPEKQQAWQTLYAMDGAALDAASARISDALTALVDEPVSVLIDTPPRDKDHPETIDVRYEGVRGRTSYPLHELSTVVAGVHADFVSVVKKIRIFVPPTVAPAVRSRQHAAELAILEAIAS